MLRGRLSITTAHKSYCMTKTPWPRGISWTLWFELLRIRRWTHISPWYVLDAPPGNLGGLLLLSSSFWHLVEMLSQSINLFYSMPTKSFTMPYHLNKGKQKHRKTSEQLNQLFRGQRRPRKSRFNYKPRLLMEGRASGYRESPAWRNTALLPRTDSRHLFIGRTASTNWISDFRSYSIFLLLRISSLLRWIPRARRFRVFRAGKPNSV
jgi:hypothetical protein